MKLRIINDMCTGVLSSRQLLKAFDSACLSVEPFPTYESLRFFYRLDIYILSAFSSTPPTALSSPPQLSYSELSGLPDNNPKPLDLEPDNHKQHQECRAALESDQLEGPENPDDVNSGGADLSAAAPTVALPFPQLSKDHDDHHHPPHPTPPARKWAHSGEYYDAQVKAQREHMLSLGCDWEDDAGCKAYKMYRRSVRRLESLPWYHLEKISLHASIGKE
jgi:hypothetical protein